MSTPYSVYKPTGSNGTNPILVPEGSIDGAYYDSVNKVGIQLVGRNALNYGTATAQNFVQLASNFSGTNFPNDSIALQGQLWFNPLSTTSGELNVRVTSTGSGGLANWKKVLLGTGPGGVLPATDGGTGTGTYTVGDILYADSTTTLAKLPIGTSGQILAVSGGSLAWVSGGGGGTSVNGISPIVVTAAGPAAVDVSLDTVPLTSGGTGATTQAGAANAVLPSQSGNNGYILTTNGSNVSWGDPASLIPSGGIQVFSSSGTFNVPAGVTKVEVTCVGGGGGGGSGSSNADPQDFYGGSGGNGAIAVKLVTVTPSTAYTVTVGPGGAGGPSGVGVGANGIAGGTTIFGVNLCEASGGGGGTYNGVGPGTNGANGSPVVYDYALNPPLIITAGLRGYGGAGGFGVGSGGTNGTDGCCIVKW